LCVLRPSSLGLIVRGGAKVAHLTCAGGVLRVLVTLRARKGVGEWVAGVPAFVVWG
jgi:hypothetical protein